MSIAISATKPQGGQFVLHANALHGDSFDGHTLGPVITELQQSTGVETRRIHVDKPIAATITKRSSECGSAARYAAADSCSFGIVNVNTSARKRSQYGRRIFVIRDACGATHAGQTLPKALRGIIR